MPNGKAYNMVLGHLPKISALYQDNFLCNVPKANYLRKIYRIDKKM